MIYCTWCDKMAEEDGRQHLEGCPAIPGTDAGSARNRDRFGQSVLKQSIRRNAAIGGSARDLHRAVIESADLSVLTIRLSDPRVKQAIAIAQGQEREHRTSIYHCPYCETLGGFGWSGALFIHLLTCQQAPR